jgi:ERF superfamily protein
MSDITNVGRQDPMLAFIERAARDPAFSVEKVEALLRLQFEQQQQVAKREFYYDLNAMQQKLDQVRKDRRNPTFNAPYATLEALDQIARPVYSQYGFSISYGTAPASQPGWIQVTCKLAHRGGWVEEHALEGPVTAEGARGGRVAQTPIQSVGSAVSYLRRYLLQLVLNLVPANNPDDDDGEGQRNQRPPPSYARQPLTEPPAEPNGYQASGNGQHAAQASQGAALEARIRRWEADTLTASTQAEADQLLISPFATAAEERLHRDNATAYGRYDRAKQAMINRLWPPTLEEDKAETETET